MRLGSRVQRAGIDGDDAQHAFAGTVVHGAPDETGSAAEAVNRQTEARGCARIAEDAHEQAAVNRSPPAQRIQGWRIERGEVDSAPDGDDGTASRGEIGGDDARLLAEIARQTLNFALGVALLEERRVDSFGDLDRGVGLRPEDRHPDRLGAELAGFGVVRLAPSKAGVVVAGVAGVAGSGIRLRVERRAERQTIDHVASAIGRRREVAGGLRSDRRGAATTHWARIWRTRGSFGPIPRFAN